jgi:Family of unknown function (DUF6081)
MKSVDPSLWNRRHALAAMGAGALQPAWAGRSKRKSSVVYDDFRRADGRRYTLDDYNSRWMNPYGLGEMVSTGGDTRSFRGNRFSISAVPFTVGFDFSVFDHLKYIAVSKQAFAVPAQGSLTFSSVIQAETPGTDPGRIIRGTYIQSGAPYAQPTFEGQQAGAVMNMIDFATGQLFDWFISGSRAFTLIERLPSNVTGVGNVGLDRAYTQIIDEFPIKRGPQKVAIRYTRIGTTSHVEFLLNGKRVSRVPYVGIPLDRQGQAYTGVYPSYGPGEPLAAQIGSFAIGHGLFSLLDAFPFQHPDRPDLAVSIPVANRLFGQGARATFDSFTVDTETED